MSNLGSLEIFNRIKKKHGISMPLIPQEIIDGEVIFQFEGNLSFDIVNDQLVALKQILNERFANNPILFKRTYNVSVECLENNLKHGLKEEKTETAFIVTFDQTSNSINILSANHVVGQEVTQLVDNLDSINKLSRDEQKELYRKKIKNTSISSKGGAGLGFLDIAIKSRTKLNYEVVNNIGENKIFVLNLCIKS